MRKFKDRGTPKHRNRSAHCAFSVTRRYFAATVAAALCACSGVFVDRFQGETGENLNAALSVFRSPETNVDVSGFVLIRQDAITPTYLESESELMLATLPSVIDNMQFFADFESPDVAMGSWSNAITLQSIDR